jgi:hypothetical protein
MQTNIGLPDSIIGHAIAFGNTQGEADANARLIAAAPAMLAALEALTAECEAEFTLDGSWVNDGQLVQKRTHERARAAIAAATGQEI